MSTIIPLEEIERSKHILIKSDEAHFPQASLLYSYLLTQHKKVSLYMDRKEERFSFLAWYEKIRLTEPHSVDLIMSASVEIIELYNCLKKNKIKINKKMATALYAGFLQRYEHFLSPECNGMVFAAVSELIESGADHMFCVEKLIYTKPLSLFRLKAIAYKKLLLKNNATVAKVNLSHEDFESTGAQWQDVEVIAREILELAHIKEVFIIQNGEKNKILKIVKDI